jgi:chemotaxis protein CheD
MNHFMLANDSGLSSGGSSARFGIHAMELLINECMKLGADRNRLEAKVFGGGHVMQDMHTAKTVPTGNIAFAMNFLKTESIPIRSIDVGGNQARKVMFFTDSGRILLSRMDCRRNVDDPELKMLKRRVSDKPTAPPAEAGDVTLF